MTQVQLLLTCMAVLSNTYLRNFYLLEPSKRFFSKGSILVESREWTEVKATDIWAPHALLGTGSHRPCRYSWCHLCTITCTGRPTCLFLKVALSPRNWVIVFNLQSISNIPNTHYLSLANVHILSYVFQFFGLLCSLHFLSPPPGVTLFLSPDRVSSWCCQVLVFVSESLELCYWTRAVR